MANNCGNCKHREVAGYKEPCSSCRTTSGGTPTKWQQQHTTQTTADRIRAMSDEELAEVLGNLVHCGGCPMRGNCKVDNLPCNNVLIEWLKQPVEGEDGQA